MSHPANVLFLLTLALIVAYLPALAGDFLWDDDAYLSENKTVTQPGRFSDIWFDTRANPQYYPLVFTSYWLEYRIWGLHTLGYHVVNVLLHAASAVLIWRLLDRLNLPGALLAACVFALHPVHVESVAWITERKNVLSGLFYFLSITAYFRFTGLADSDPATVRQWRWYALAFLAFVAALLSKSVTATLPAVILLLIWWKRGRVRQLDLLALVPMLLVGIALGLHTAWLESTHVGAAKDDWTLTFIERGLVAGRALCFYVGKLIWPVGLSFVYPRWTTDARQVWQFAFPFVAVTVLILTFLLRNRIGREPFVALACFAGTLFPALGFLRVFPHRYSFVADHFQYLASVFPIILIVAILSRLARSIPRGVRRIAALALLISLAALTHRQARAYQDGGTLWQDAIAKNPDAWMAHGNYADWLSLKGRQEEAVESYHRSLRLKPDAPLIHFHLALALEALNRFDEAEAGYRQALSLQPDHLPSRINLGRACARRGALDEAESHFRKAIDTDPTSAPAQYHLAHLLLSQGRVDEGRRHYQEAIRLKPDYWEARVNDASAAWAQGRLDEAAAGYREILRRNPGHPEAMLNLGSLLVQRGNIDEALSLLRDAAALQPRNVTIRLRLAQALEIAGRTSEAVANYRDVLILEPNHAEARQALARLAADGH